MGERGAFGGGVLSAAAAREKPWLVVGFAIQTRGSGAGGCVGGLCGLADACWEELAGDGWGGLLCYVVSAPAGSTYYYLLFKS